MPQITSAEVTPNPIALGQTGRVQLASTPTQGGTLSAEVKISASNDVFFVSNSKTLTANPNGAKSFKLERRPGPGLTSPHSVVFFISVKETGVAAQSKRERLVDIAG